MRIRMRVRYHRNTRAQRRSKRSSRHMGGEPWRLLNERTEGDLVYERGYAITQL